MALKFVTSGSLTMNPLLQYVHHENGPVISVTSSLQPGFFKPFYWRSIAKLSDDYCSIFGARFVIPLLASGWHADKHQSQEDAITAALILWAQYIYRDNGEVLGKHINANDDGFAMAHSLPESTVKQMATKKAIHAWAKQQLVENPALRLRPGSLPLLNRIRFLFPLGEGQLFLLYAPIKSGDETLYFAISIFQFKSGECIFGSACETSESQAFDAAVLDGYTKYHTIQKIYAGAEQLLDKIAMQRMWYFATDAAMGISAVNSLLKRVHAESYWELNDPVLFSETIKGPWENNLILHRVLYTTSKDTNNLKELPL
jgi:hypothetical protein